MNYKSFIESKKKGELTEEKIKQFVSALAADELSEKQILEIVKAFDKYGCTNQEVYFMAKHMADSGVNLNLQKEIGFCVDKQSIGTVSDGITLIVMSVLASLDIKCVKVLSDSYGIHDNLLSKLKSFRGFNALLTREEMVEKAKHHGVGFIENQGNIAPVADKLYKICKENDMLIEPIISVSIIAQKIATGISLLVLDVKSGEGSVIAPDSATVLADRLVQVGNLAGIKTVAVITDFNWPISASVGVGLELQEIKDTLSNAKEYSGSNMLKLAKEMVTCVLLSCDKAAGRSKASDMFDEVIKNGKAYEKFCSVIDAYNGNPASVNRIEKLIDTAVSYITADFDGYVNNINMKKLYDSIRFVISNKGEFDNSAGIVLMCAEGEKVQAGQKLAKVFYSHDNNRYFKTAKTLFEVFEIAKDKVVKNNNLFIKVVI